MAVVEREFWHASGLTGLYLKIYDMGNNFDYNIYVKVFKSSFLTNLFKDISIVYIFYKSSQTGNTEKTTVK